METLKSQITFEKAQQRRAWMMQGHNFVQFLQSHKGRAWKLKSKVRRNRIGR